jgi:hypothetical protein
MKPFWTTRKLETLKSLVGSHTNQELADYFGTTIRHIKYTLNHFKIARTPEQIKFLQAREDRFHRFGNKNPNWKGGISKDNYHYKKLQKQRYPERIKARSIVSKRIESGKIKRENCKFCGTDKNIQAHIKDYKDPLNSIVWCCRRCNIEHHHSKTQNRNFINHEKDNNARNGAGRR